MSESTQVVSYEEELKCQLANQQLALTKVAGGSKFISCKGGLMTIDNQPVPNNSLDVIVVGFVTDRAWYSGPYDPESIQAPDCYAIDTALPHEKAKNKQCTECATCPKNQWGSATRDGKPTRGKACRESVRVLVIPGNNLEREFIQAAEMRMVKFPPTSIANFREFVSGCTNAGKLTWQCVTRLQVKPDTKTMFKVIMTPLQEIKDQEALRSVMRRLTEARNEILTPYMEDEEEPEVDEQPAKKKKF